MSVGCSTVGFMKILHTSDWHIGRTFHGVDLLADQASVLGSIADSVREHSVDVVVVPGDIYDRSIPSSDAVTVCNRGFEAIRAAGAVIVATSGNHDSAVAARSRGILCRCRRLALDHPESARSVLR